MSKIYNFFPLSIYRGKIELPENTKKEMVKEIISMKETSDQGLKPSQNAWTGDTHGYEYLFQNKKFETFYKEVEKHVIKYMDHFELDVSKLDFYFQRSWATLSNSKEHISPHDHSQSNLSFAYYLKKQPGDSQLVLVDKNLMPKTHNELKEWVIEKSQQKDYLVKTDVALDVYDIIGGGPVPKHIKPIWPFIAFTAFNTLPKEFKDIYGIKSSKLKSVLVNFNLFLLKFTRPFLPPFFRLIAPARWAKQRITKNPSLKFNDKAQI